MVLALWSPDLDCYRLIVHDYVPVYAHPFHLHLPLRPSPLIHPAFSPLKSLTSSLPSSFLTTPSLSAGLGLIYRFDPVRVEVNFGLPLAISKGEGARRGVGVGVGVEFL